MTQGSENLSAMTTLSSRLGLGFVSILVMLAFSRVVSAQGELPAATPRVLVEGFRYTDSLTRQAAIAVRNELQARVSRDTLWVMPTRQIEAQREMGAPDDFGGAWSWADLREVSTI